MGEIGKRANISVSWIGKSKTFMQMFAILFLLLYDQPLFIVSVLCSFNMMGLVLSICQLQCTYFVVWF